MTIIEKYLKSFEAYTNDELSAVDSLAFEEKLKNDDLMQGAWDEYRSMLQALSDREAIRLRIMLNQEFSKLHNYRKNHYLIGSSLFRVSAAAIIVVIMGGLLYFFCSNNLPARIFVETHQDETVDTTSIIDIEVKKDNVESDAGSEVEQNLASESRSTQFASLYDNEEYQISPVFEGLLHNVYRSSWFEIRTPEDSVQFSAGDSLFFSWETNIQDSLYFDVLDRNGQIIYKHPGAVISPWYFCPDFEPAIYMYRFATREEPVWVGVMVRK